jgi:hypothetical protein
MSLAMRRPRLEPALKRRATRQDAASDVLNSGPLRSLTHVWMAPAVQEVMGRAWCRGRLQSCWCSPGGLLALMGSAHRDLIIRTGSLSR